MSASNPETYKPLNVKYPRGYDVTELDDEELKQLVRERYAGQPEASEWHTNDEAFWERFCAATHETLVDMANKPNALNTPLEINWYRSYIEEYKRFCEQHGVTPNAEPLEAFILSK